MTRRPAGLIRSPVLAAIRTWEDVGVDHLALHQIGPDQEGFLRF
jgi:hypothetical protein